MGPGVDLKGSTGSTENRHTGSLAAGSDAPAVVGFFLTMRNLK